MIEYQHGDRRVYEMPRCYPAHETRAEVESQVTLASAIRDNQQMQIQQPAVISRGAVNSIAQRGSIATGRKSKKAIHSSVNKRSKERTDLSRPAYKREDRP
jgi:hypothetical protein